MGGGYRKLGTFRYIFVYCFIHETLGRLVNLMLNVIANEILVSPVLASPHNVNLSYVFLKMFGRTEQSS